MVDQLERDAPTEVEPGTAVPGRLRRGLPDVVALAALVAAFFVANDVSLWVQAPYWLDETWVALSTRVPLSDLPFITSSTPIGWSLLLRLIPDPDALRVLPLAFALVALVAAYALGRLLPWRSRAESVLAGFACGGAVLLLPAEQVRHDLKQYTADAAIALTYLALTAWLERGWSRRRLLVLVAAAPVGFVLSQVTLVVAAVAFAGLFVLALVHRDWRRLAETAIAGAVAGLCLGILYVVFVAPNRSSALTNFWIGYYPSVRELPSYLRLHAAGFAPILGFPRPAIAAPVLLVGLVVLAVRRRFATLIAIVAIPVCMVVLGVARVYPLLDERTSYFMLATAAVLGGVAVAGCAIGLARLVLRRTDRFRWLVAGVLVLAALGLFAVHNRQWYRFDGDDPRVPDSSPIAVSDVRTQTRWIDEHRAPGDVVVISMLARFGYDYYHSDAPLTWERAGNTIGWWPVVPPAPNVVVVQGTSLRDIEDALNQATAMARRNGPGARVLLLRTWLLDEADSWQTALRPYSLSYPYSGVEPVTIIANP